MAAPAGGQPLPRGVLSFFYLIEHGTMHGAWTLEPCGRLIGFVVHFIECCLVFAFLPCFLVCHVFLRVFLMGFRRYESLVRRVEEVESRIKMAGESSPGTDAEGAGGGGVVGGELALAAARGYYKVLSYKDEYEVCSTCACHPFLPSPLFWAEFAGSFQHSGGREIIRPTQRSDPRTLTIQVARLMCDGTVERELSKTLESGKNQHPNCLRDSQELHTS